MVNVPEASLSKLLGAFKGMGSCILRAHFPAVTVVRITPRSGLLRCSPALTLLTCAALRKRARNKAAKAAAKERRTMALRRKRRQGVVSGRYSLQAQAGGRFIVGCVSPWFFYSGFSRKETKKSCINYSVL